MNDFNINNRGLGPVVYQSLVTLMRLMFGMGWFMAGLTKITGKAGEISWFRYPGQFLVNYFENALIKPTVPDWYKLFIHGFALHHILIFNYIIPLAEIVVGLFMIMGFIMIPTIIACLFMHINFILSGNMNLISLTLYTSSFGILLHIDQSFVFSIDRYLKWDLRFLPTYNKRKKGNIKHFPTENTS
ncbi:hypothetical protein [Paenibacillus sp. GP183]|uniref:hypothetical protein n=1 Tax=Paenibacillus sp. GP183 TaxID=1882751 RepID=UPI00089AF491|nr:hypothetical protein [Paenibacillus sp. GP183]SEB79769.1 thiosulfate dehydrogenase [quinone] large subunit [Paenibacillus sp. GP183]